jgi:DNA-binding CsgD family transcriptional regulator
MDLAPLVRAVEALMSPEAWGSRDAWLAECLRRVREVRGAPGQALPADAVTELEALLHLPGDEPGWLQATFESLDAERWDGGALPAMTGASEAFMPVVSLRCALIAGLATLERLPALPTTQELRITFGLRGREPQVALLAAEGLSNAAIAQRLRLSAHTVRHYLERVLDRLGLHTRKALALRLMGGNGERSQPPDRPSRRSG